MTTRQLIGIAALALSAMGLVKLVNDESFTPVAVIPVQGDRPTVGFGSTFRDDGSPVQMGDTITVPQALKRTLAHIQKDETRLKACVTAPLTQVEYDLLEDHAYQYGAATTCNSPMVKRANAGDYAGACRGYLEYKFIRINGKPYDCSTPGNRVCSGVWKRSVGRYDKCMGDQ